HMGKKLIHVAEHGVGRVSRELPQQPAVQGITRRWPELRIVRFPDTDRGQYIDDWHIFLDDIGGSRNYGKGKARALGSMAITYISAKEFGLMLEAKYGNGKDYNTPEKAARLVDKMRTGMRVFMQEAHRNAYDNRTDAIQGKISDIVVASTFTVRNVAGDSMGPTDEWVDREADIATAVDTGQTAPIWFDAADLAVKGLGQYGDGYGLDLSLNPVLFDERHGLLEYLRIY